MQAPSQAPSLILNNSGSRQQVPLRDYLNTRLAPFLKKAITESLDKEAEFPLQWLGECLINQSILYEGNNDPTNIKERFRYTFEVPEPVQQPQPVEPQPPQQTDMETETTTGTNGVPPFTAATTTSGFAQPQQETVAVNGENTVDTSAGQKTLEPVVETQTPAQPQPQVAIVATSTAPAGVDTEMGGTA